MYCKYIKYFEGKMIFASKNTLYIKMGNLFATHVLFIPEGIIMNTWFPFLWNFWRQKVIIMKWCKPLSNIYITLFQNESVYDFCIFICKMKLCMWIVHKLESLNKFAKHNIAVFGIYKYHPLFCANPYNLRVWIANLQYRTIDYTNT